MPKPCLQEINASTEGRIHRLPRAGQNRGGAAQTAVRHAEIRRNSTASGARPPPSCVGAASFPLRQLDLVQRRGRRVPWRQPPPQVATRAGAP